MAHPSAMIGRKLLHYQIAEKLGEGGMGVVYKAHDTHLDRFVAIKVLRPENLGDPTRKARFVQEAKAASALHHPNIVVVHDVASEDGTDFIVMEYVEGRTLDQIIDGKPLPIPLVFDIGIQVANALARAHSAGIVHRDLKPSNVIMDEQGLVKLLDFGLAKLAEEETTADGATATLHLKTAEGKIVGTAAYMSPEQAEGKAVDARSDIFSFGELLYEMASGRRAFEGDTNISVLVSVIANAPQALRGVPPELATVINRCLRKDPSRRYQDMSHVKTDLEEARDLMSATAKLRMRRRLRTALLGCIAGVLIGGAAVAWWYWRARPGAGPPPSVVPLTSYRGNESFPAFSPDGKQVAFVWTGDGGDRSNIYVKAIGADNPTRVTNDSRLEASPAWSPDGRYIAFLRQEEPLKAGCYVVPTAGGGERKVADLSGQISTMFRGLAWLPDSRRLVVGILGSASWHQGGKQGLRVVSIDSGAQDTWTIPNGPRGHDVAPGVSPDGRRLAFARVFDVDRSELFLMDIPAPGGKPSTPARVAVPQPGAAEPVWTRDGSELIYTAGFSGQPSFWRADPARPDAARQVQITGLNVMHPAIATTGNRMAYATSFLERPDIYRLMLSAPGVAAGAPEILIASSQVDQNPVYSPDGSLIAFESSRSGSSEIWIADKEGRNPVQITTLGTRPNSPVWSPDGRQIAFRCPAEGTDEVCVASTLGGAVRILTNNPAQDRAVAWSADAKWILFNSTRGGRPQIWKVAAAGGDAQFVSEVGPARVSRDGKTNFRVDAAGWVFAEPAGGGLGERLFGPVMMGNWAQAADGFYFIPRAKDRAYALKYYDLRTKTAREVAPLKGTPGWGMSLAPDGRSILLTISELDASGSDLMLVENYR